MKNQKSSDISHDMACYLEKSWSLYNKNSDSKEGIMEIISEYARCNNLDLTKELSREDYIFLIDDLSRRGLFQGKDKNAAASMIWQSHVQSLDKIEPVNN